MVQVLIKIIHLYGNDPTFTAPGLIADTTEVPTTTVAITTTNSSDDNGGVFSEYRELILIALVVFICRIVVCFVMVAIRVIHRKSDQGKMYNVNLMRI